MTKQINRNQGFTLIELLVVIAIIGILMAVMIPSIASYTDKAKDSAALQEVNPIATTAFAAWEFERDQVGFDPDQAGDDDFDAYLVAEGMLLTNANIGDSTTGAGDPFTNHTGTNYSDGFVYKATNGRYVTVTFSSNGVPVYVVSEDAIVGSETFSWYR